MSLSTFRSRVHLAEGTDVIERPKGAPVCGHDQVIAFYGEIVNGCGRQIEFQRLPAPAIIERNVNAVFRARIKQALALRIFSNSVRVTIVRQSRRDFRPRLAIIGRFEKVRMEVIQFVAVNGDVCCAGGVWRSIDDANQAPVPEFFGSDVGPVLAAIAGDMDESVVAPSPNEAFLE